MKNSNKKNAFTLAEVLITLGIMGCLMALTIPVMINSVSNDSYVSGLKKTYSLLDEATRRIMLNNSGTMKYAMSSCVSTNNTFRDLYGNFLDYNKTCNNGAAVGNCWASTVKKLNGNPPSTGYNAPSAVLADGSFVMFSPNCSAGLMNCASTNVSSVLPYDSAFRIGCASIYVDVNGFNAPNQWGRDVFTIYVGPDGLYPSGEAHTVDNSYTCDPASASVRVQHGASCTNRVLTEGAMNY